jgi:hypothetical protein
MRLCVLNQPTPNKLINKCNILSFAGEPLPSSRTEGGASSALAWMSNVRLEAVIKLLISNSCNYNCAISSCRGGEAKKKGRKQQFSARGLEGAKKKSEGSRGGKNYNTIESFQSNFSPEKAEGK